MQADPAVDAHYTPPAIARRLAEVVADVAPPSPRVVDFAVGGGALLGAVGDLVRDASLHGSDISRQVVRRLRQERPEWHLEPCDFLSSSCRAASVVAGPDAKYDTVVLNPPFSYRGNAARIIERQGQVLRCSPCAAFMLLAAEYAPGGQMVAVVPRSTLFSERDEEAWNYLRRRWTPRVRVEYGVRAFPGLAAATAIVELVPRRESSAVQSVGLEAGSAALPVKLVRGCLPMHAVVHASNGGGALLHTTGLRRGRLKYVRVRNTDGRRVTGPVVLVPRVGAPDREKMVVYRDPWPILLSDCVIALVCDDEATAEAVLSTLDAEWESFSSMAWGGSCAPYTTLRRLASALACHGIRADQTPELPIPRSPRALAGNESTALSDGAPCGTTSS